MLDPALEVLLVHTPRDVPVDTRGRGTRRAVLVRQAERDRGEWAWKWEREPPNEEYALG